MNTVVGAKIKYLRKEKGLSQEQVAEYLHVSQSTYARIENGAILLFLVEININQCNEYRYQKKCIIPNTIILIYNNSIT